MSEEINAVIQKYIDEQDLANAVLLVYQDDSMAYSGCFGYSSLEQKTPAAYDTVFRIMSMTKVVTALCIMKLIEQGKLVLGDPVEKYIHEFADQKTAIAGQYTFDPDHPAKLLKYLVGFSLNKVRCEERNRPVTVRDLLSHSSGLEQGVVGLLNMLKNKKLRQSSLAENVRMYARLPLDFQPGTDTSYSPLAGFNVLGYLVSIIAGESLESFMQREICEPLDMKNTSFFLREDMKKKLCEVYKRKHGKLINVSGTDEDLYAVLRMVPQSYEAGAGGLYSTAEDFEHLARMLLKEGVFEGKEVFRKETVAMIHTPGAYQYLEKDPGLTWGLGVKIRMNPEKAGCAASEGTYGWSGAFGTHFFVSPKDRLEAVFMTNRSDLEGSSSYVSKKMEELVFRYFGKGK